MATEDARKLFVAGLPESITEEVLRDLFLATGATVVNVSLPKDRTTGRPRGFGFVTLSTAEEAESARQALDGSIQAGRSISVRPFQSEPPRRGEPHSGPRGGAGGGGGGEPSSGGGGPGAGEDRTLYVGNLPYDTSQAEVERLFADSGAGPVVRVHLPAGPDGRLRGFGFVTLPSGEAANAALAALRDAEVRGRRLMINIAHPRGAGGGGGGGGGPRSGPHSGPPSHGPRSGGFDPGFAPPGFESARPVEGRRVRGGGPSGERSGGGEGGGGGEDWKKKKKKKGGGQTERPKQERTNWQRWEDWDED
jgi:RNA recognition motif-containing protein